MKNHGCDESSRFGCFVSFRVVSHFFNLFVLREKIRDLARVQHVVEILEHGLHHDLRVREEESGALALHASFDLCEVSKSGTGWRQSSRAHRAIPNGASSAGIPLLRLLRQLRVEGRIMSSCR